MNEYLERVKLSAAGQRARIAPPEARGVHASFIEAVQ